MAESFEELFRALHQFKKLNVVSMLPGISNSEFAVMGAIVSQREKGNITISEIAAMTRTLPPAVSRTIRSLEEKGLVERSVDKKDRRNTYVSLTEKGEETAKEVKEKMHSFGCAVMAQIKEEELQQLVAYLDHIYAIAEKEIETRKQQNKEE